MAHGILSSFISYWPHIRILLNHMRAIRGILFPIRSVLALDPRENITGKWHTFTITSWKKAFHIAQREARLEPSAEKIDFNLALSSLFTIYLCHAATDLFGVLIFISQSLFTGLRTSETDRPFTGRIRDFTTGYFLYIVSVSHIRPSWHAIF